MIHQEDRSDKFAQTEKNSKDTSFRTAGSRKSERRPVLDGNLIRLIGLLLALVTVVIAMSISAQPETWERLGFGAVEENENEGPTGEESQIAEKFPAIVSMVPGNDSSTQDSQSRDDRNGQSPPEGFQFELKRESPVLAKMESEFWRQSYSRLSQVERRTLYRWLRFAENRITADEDTRSEFVRLSKRFQKWRDDFHHGLLEHIASLDGRLDAEKRSWNEILLKLQDEWKLNSWPALTDRLNGESVTGEMEGALQRVRKRIFEQALSAVTDGTPLSRSEDAVAWLMTLEELQPGKNFGNPVSVSQVELSSQPIQFRGQAVTFRGRVRAAKFWQPKQHELGIDRMYLLFLQSENPTTIPICVATTKMPPNFPPIERDWVELDESLVITGVFFKVRSYQAKGGFRECPLVLANEPQWIPSSLKESESSQLPSWKWFAGLLTLIAIFAIIVAAGIFRFTERNTHGIGKEDAELSQDLAELSRNPDVETVSERLKKMSRPG